MEKLSEYVKRMVDDAPPLRQEQKDRLRSMLAEPPVRRRDRRGDRPDDADH